MTLIGTSGLFQIYDRRVKPKYFIGQYTLPLIPLLPWISDFETALEDVSPSLDYEDSIDLKKLGEFMPISVGMIRLYLGQLLEPRLDTTQLLPAFGLQEESCVATEVKIIRTSAR